MPEPLRHRSSDPIAEQEIKHEQAVVDRIYTRLAAATKAAQTLAAEGHARARLGNEGGLVERDAMVFQAAKRLAALDAAHEGLVFGRLDLRDRSTRYIGRLGLRDADREVLLVDWRAPAAAVFYQATATDAQGVVRRRVLQSRGDRVVALEDDLLDPDAGDELVMVGEGALMAALTRTRDQTMHSVVATIQREQDAAIRSPHAGVTVISGGPGTGKTVVALHRAAYLLYTDRRRYEGGGVLVVGPNAIFMRYIERVLPSLGETNVSLRALGGVVDGIEATRHDDDGVAVLKGSARMSSVLARAAGGPVPGAPTEFRLFYRDDVVSLDAADLRRLRSKLLASGQRRNRVAGQVPKELVRLLWRQVSGERARSRGYEDFAATLFGDRRFTDFASAWWPVVDAVDVLRWLADRDRLADDAGDRLSAVDIERLASALTPVDLSVEDVPLVDDLRYLLGEPEIEPEPDPLGDLYDETFPELSVSGGGSRSTGDLPAGRLTTSVDDDTFAHVLIDEAQDLSPMQWRMLGRRGRSATWTIVGDSAQSSWPRLDEAARARAEALGSKDQRIFRLSTNYRNSKEIFALAVELARRALPAADLPIAVRSTGVQPRLQLVSTADLPAAVRRATAAVVDEVDGTVGVVVPRIWRTRVQTWLGGTDVDRVSVLEALDTKGLEFDACVVVEPDAIVAESVVGVATLYVVLTRATSRLDVVGTSEAWRHSPPTACVAGSTGAAW